MRRAVAALQTLAVAASLAATCVTITAAPAMAASHLAAGRIAFDDFVTNQIYAVNPDGSGLAQLTHEPSGLAARWPDWSPNGSRILFVPFNLSNGMGRIWIMNADGTGQRQLVSDTPGYRDYQPKYTPDGRHIVFARCSPNDGLCAIWIMRSDGTHRHLLVPFIESPNETNNLYPVVSPDGRHIAYARFGFDGIRAQVWVARINGTQAHPLTAPRLEATQPNWSPGSSHIAFASNSDRPQSSIYIMQANGTEVTRLATTKWPTDNFGPAYSPSGGQIAFASDRRHPDLCCVELFVMRADGSRQHLVDTGIQGVIDIAWGSAPPVPAGSPGTLTRPAAGRAVPGAPRNAGCREAPARAAIVWCGASVAGQARWRRWTRPPTRTIPRRTRTR
jgi:dipeptidyl aminopeptidase/acylaminoacyl peptidase